MKIEDMEYNVNYSKEIFNEIMENFTCVNEYISHDMIVVRLFVNKDNLCRNEGDEFVLMFENLEGEITYWFNKKNKTCIGIKNNTSTV